MEGSILYKWVKSGMIFMNRHRTPLYFYGMGLAALTVCNTKIVILSNDV